MLGTVKSQGSSILEVFLWGGLPSSFIGTFPVKGFVRSFGSPLSSFLASFASLTTPLILTNAKKVLFRSEMQPHLRAERLRCLYISRLASSIRSSSHGIQAGLLTRVKGRNFVGSGVWGLVVGFDRTIMFNLGTSKVNDAQLVGFIYDNVTFRQVMVTNAKFFMKAYNHAHDSLAERA